MGEQRELKNRTRFSTTLDNEIYRKLKEYSRKTDVPITKVMDKAIAMYLQNIDKLEQHQVLFQIH